MDKLRMTDCKLHSFEFCDATTQENIFQLYSHTSFESEMKSRGMSFKLDLLFI